MISTNKNFHIHIYSFSLLFALTMSEKEGEAAYVTQANLEKLANDFNTQLNDNMSVLRREILEELRKERSPVGVYDEAVELDEIDEERAA